MESLLCAKHLVVHRTDKVPGVTAIQEKKQEVQRSWGKNRLSSFEDKTGGQYG